MNIISISKILLFVVTISFISACGGGGENEINTPTPVPTPAPETTPVPEPTPVPTPVGMSALHTDGVKWVNAADDTVILKGTNLG
ncbi:MAG: hypothetical protein ACI936_003956, partial [Paraglaciecola sp.]